MKKIISIILAVMLLLSVGLFACDCGGGAGGGKPPKTTSLADLTKDFDYDSLVSEKFTGTEEEIENQIRNAFKKVFECTSNVNFTIDGTRFSEGGTSNRIIKYAPGIELSIDKSADEISYRYVEYYTVGGSVYKVLNYLYYKMLYKVDGEFVENDWEMETVTKRYRTNEFVLSELDMEQIEENVLSLGVYYNDNLNCYCADMPEEDYGQGSQFRFKIVEGACVYYELESEGKKFYDKYYDFGNTIINLKEIGLDLSKFN